MNVQVNPRVRALIPRSFSGLWMMALLAAVPALTGANTVLLQVNSEPSEAAVYLNGDFRGTTPLSLSGLAPGIHLLSLRKSLHRDANQTLTLTAQDRRLIEVALEPIRGLVLVRSTPPGAEVIVDGAVLDTTPTLIRHLEIGHYRVRLAMTGFQPRELDLRITDRSPLLLDTELISDSATLRIVTHPPGASIAINGIPRGTAPLTLSRIPEGDVQIDATLSGYQTFRQSLRLSAGDEENLDIVLTAQPCRLQIESQPGGARVYLDNQFQGTAPLTLEELQSGNYRVRLELLGHDAMARNVVLAHGETRTEEFRLTPNTGRIEITTEPSGVSVFVDGREAGISPVPATGSDRISNPLTIGMVPAGTREIRLSLRGYFDQVFQVEMERGKTHANHYALERRFIPNYEVATEQRLYRGVLDGITHEFIRLETAQGVILPIPLRDVRYHRPLRQDGGADAPRPQDD